MEQSCSFHSTSVMFQSWPPGDTREYGCQSQSTTLFSQTFGWEGGREGVWGWGWCGDTADLKNIHFSLKLCHLPFYKAKVATLPVARFLGVLGENVGEKVQHKVLQLGGFQAVLTAGADIWRAAARIA